MEVGSFTACAMSSYFLSCLGVGCLWFLVANSLKIYFMTLEEDAMLFSFPYNPALSRISLIMIAHLSHAICRTQDTTSKSTFNDVFPRPCHGLSKPLPLPKAKPDTSLASDAVS
jgi:hypothetical protein